MRVDCKVNENEQYLYKKLINFNALSKNKYYKQNSLIYKKVNKQ